jgi:Tfp pilus assembly protein PilF
MRRSIPVVVALVPLAFIAASGMVLGAPYRPTDAAVVLERLPLKPGDERARQLAAARARLAAEPRNPEPAVEVADRYFDLAGAEGDPRYIGYAEAALSPWARDPQSPTEVLIMRGKLLQWRHEFEPALKLFDEVLKREPGHYDALSWRAAVNTVLADYDGARRDCLALREKEQELFWASCAAYVDSLTGQAAEAGRRMADLLARNPGASAGQKLWLLTRLADIATRLGRPAEADRHYRAALALDVKSQNLLAGYADFLLDERRPAEVVALLRDSTRSDVLLLRLALAEQALGAPEFKARAQILRERFAAAALRGDTLHQQEESRFQLLIERNAERALGLAVANWKVQREPYDARILLEAALAAGRAAPAGPVLEWLERSRHEDPRIAVLARTLKERKP